MRALIRSCLYVPNTLFRWSSDWTHRPVLSDPASICPELQILEQNFEIIQSEYRSACRYVEESPRYHEVDSLQAKISGTDDERSWRAFFLVAMGRKIASNRRKLPVASHLIDQIPNVFQAFISRLDPRKSIPVHSSPYEGYLRYHLALEVPRNNPPYMIVENVELYWTEGRGVMFDDTFPHTVINQSSEPRTVLIVDVERPMKALGRAACRTVVWILKHTYARRIEKKIEPNPWTV